MDKVFGIEFYSVCLKMIVLSKANDQYFIFTLLQARFTLIFMLRLNYFPNPP